MTPEEIPSTPAPGSSEPVVPPTTPDESAPATPGYFNQVQSEEVEVARKVKTHCEKAELQEALTKEGITAEVLKSYGGLVKECSRRLVGTAASHDDKKADTTVTSKARTALLHLLKDVQSTAKQHSRLVRAAGGQFSLDGYLIGQNLASNRALLLTNADALRAKAAKDALPGYDAAKLEAIDTAKIVFENTKDEQSAGQTESTIETISRNALMARLNDTRIAIQHALDRIYPHQIEANVPVRRQLGLPPHRRMKD